MSNSETTSTAYSRKEKKLALKIRKFLEKQKELHRRNRRYHMMDINYEHLPEGGLVLRDLPGEVDKGDYDD